MIRSIKIVSTMEALKNYLEYHLVRVRELPPSKEREVLVAKLLVGLEAYQEAFRLTGGVLSSSVEPENRVVSV